MKLEVYALKTCETCRRALKALREMDGAEIVVVAYGTAGRIVQTAVKQARAEGTPVGLFRPISMFPFPYERLAEVTKTAKHILVVELSAGQMIEDVALALARSRPIHFLNRMGGMLVSPDEVVAKVKSMIEGRSEEVHIG